MKIKSLKLKLIIITVLFVIISLSLSIIFSSTDLYYRNKKDITTFKKDEMARVKASLKNYLDIAYETVLSNYNNSQDTDFLVEKYGDRLKNIIDIAESSINAKLLLVRNNKLSEAEAKRQIIQELKKLRYDNGKGYIWINDTGSPYPKMVMHPITPELNGRVLNSPKYNCALGTNKNLFIAFVEACEKTGEGFVDYLWPKPTETGVTKDMPKLSYVKLIKEWNWIIGTGIYVDDAMDDAKKMSIQTIKEMRYDNNVGYFWINDTEKPYPKMIMHPITPRLDGKILNNPDYNCAMGKNQNLFQAAVDVCEADGEGYIDYLWAKPTEDGLTNQLPKVSFVRYFKEWDWIIGTGIYIDSIDKIIRDKEKTTTSQIIGVILKNTLIALLISILAVLVIIIFVSRTLNPLKEMKYIVNNVSSGNLNNSIKVRTQDEIGDISKNINKLIESIKEVITKVTKSIEVLSKSTQNLSITSKQISTTSNEQAASVKEIVSTMEDSDDLSKSVAVKINEVAKISNQSQELVEKGFVFIKKNLSQMSEIKDNNTKNIEGIKSLAEKITNIWEIINIINNIADQTKIIAFNAELEASAAGESGKNFKIVASEIRRLADNTVNSTNAIKSKINEIQHSSDSLIIASEEGTKKIKEGWFLSTNLRKIFEDILNSSEISAISAKQIAASVNQQASAFGQILLTLKQISSGIENFADSTASTTETSVEINSMISELRTLLNKYTIDEEN